MLEVQGCVLLLQRAHQGGELPWWPNFLHFHDIDLGLAFPQGSMSGVNVFSFRFLRRYLEGYWDPFPLQRR